MGKKKYIGLSIEGHNIVAVQMQYQNKKYVVTATELINIAELLGVSVPSEEETVLETGEDLFGFAEAGESQAKNTPGIAEELADFTTGDDWLSGHSDDLPDPMSKAVTDLHRVLVKLGDKKIQVGVTIPIGNTMFTTMNKPDDIKKKAKINTFVKGRIESIYGIEHAEKDSFRWNLISKNSLSVASTLERVLLMQLLERINALYPHKVFISSLVPEETALLKFATISDSEQEGSIALITLQNEGARIVFATKDKIQSAMPLIPMKQKGKNFINKVFSRIMMELEKGQVSFVQRFLVYDRTGDGSYLIQLLQENFEGISSDLLKTGAGVVFHDDDVEERTLSRHLSAVSAALSATGYQTTLEQAFNFLPADVIDRQKVFKLKWHGVLLLLLIALAPLTANIVYQEIHKESTELAFKIERTAQQIESFEEIQQQLRLLDNQNNLLRQQVLRVDELSKGSYLWSETLSLLVTGVQNIPNTWITSLQYNEQGFVIEGLTLFRDRIPAVANMFAQSGIMRVMVSETRDRNVFTFTIVVGKITDDPSIFDPQVTFEGEVAL